MAIRNTEAMIGRRGLMRGAALVAAAAVAPRGVRAQPVVKVSEPAAVGSAAITSRAVNLLGTSVNFAYAVKAGPFVYLNGHEGFDFEQGFLPEVAGQPGFPDYGHPRQRREADFLLARMVRILKEFGTDPAHAVRLDQYYTSGDAVRAYHLARFAAFGTYIPPSTSTLTDHCFAAASNVSTSLVAVVPDPQWEVKGVYPENANISPTSGYAPAVTCGDLVFLAGEGAEQKVTADSADPGYPHTRWRKPLAIRMQAESAIARIERTLKAAGSSLADCLKAEIRIHDTGNFPDFLDVWSERFRASPCAITVVPATGFASVEMILEINIVALKTGAGRKKQVVQVDLPEMATYGPCVRAGEFIFPSGIMPIGRDGRVAGAAQAADFVGLSLASQAQATMIYDYAEAVCKATGTTMANAVRAHYWIDDIRHFPGIAMAWSRRYGNAPHPFACVVTPPPMPAPGANVLADFWLYAA